MAVISDLLDDFSVSQIYGIIYRAANNALRFKKEKRVPDRHAVNTIIGSAHNYAKRAKIKNWQLTKYSRPYYCPESALCKFFFEKVLKIGCDAGFNEVPRIITEPADN